MAAIDRWADIARYSLAMAVAIVILVVAIWDGACYFFHRDELTVTSIFRAWFAADPTLVVLATILFCHLVIQR